MIRIEKRRGLFLANKNPIFKVSIFMAHEIKSYHLTDSNRTFEETLTKLIRKLTGDRWIEISIFSKLI